MEGFYCPGDGQAYVCPPHSSTATLRRTRNDCECLPGYFGVPSVGSDGSQQTNCQPCGRKSYKPNRGNAECPLSCPANADSELAATSLSDCFCEVNYYASIDSGQLAKCIHCKFEGLDCRGGFENQTHSTSQVGVHALPIALFLVCSLSFWVLLLRMSCAKPA